MPERCKMTLYLMSVTYLAREPLAGILQSFTWLFREQQVLKHGTLKLSSWLCFNINVSCELGVALWRAKAPVGHTTDWFDARVITSQTCCLLPPATFTVNALNLQVHYCRSSHTRTYTPKPSAALRGSILSIVFPRDSTNGEQEVHLTRAC